MKKVLFFCAFTLVLIATIGCHRRVTYPATVSDDGKYDMAFPFGGNADAIEEILKPFKLLNCTAYYESYFFPPSAKIRKEDITPELFKNNKFVKAVYNDFAVGTATIIYSEFNRIAVLSSAHVIDFADTIYTFYESATEGAEPYLHRVAFKGKQKNFLADLRQGEDFKIIVMDREADLAILGKEFLFTPPKRPPVFNYPLGSAGELQWGNLVYLIGFPSGKKMITTGIVSSPDRNRNHDFLVDALFNRGFSGGIALALRDGYPNFEMVGMINSVSAEDEVVLVPGEVLDNAELHLNAPYRGDIYVTTRKKINYGVSFGTSIETITQFIARNRDKLENGGFNTRNFFR